MDDIPNMDFRENPRPTGQEKYAAIHSPPASGNNSWRRPAQYTCQYKIFKAKIQTEYDECRGEIS